MVIALEDAKPSGNGGKTKGKTAVEVEPFVVPTAAARKVCASCFIYSEAISAIFGFYRSHFIDSKRCCPRRVIS